MRGNPPKESNLGGAAAILRVAFSSFFLLCFVFFLFTIKYWGKKKTEQNRTDVFCRAYKCLFVHFNSVLFFLLFFDYLFILVRNKLFFFFWSIKQTINICRKIRIDSSFF